jgi:hypothetical protein
MSTEEKVRERVEGLTEEEAREALRLLDLGTDPVVVAFRDARVDDELFTDEAAAARAKAQADVAAGHSASLDAGFRELG